MNQDRSRFPDLVKAKSMIDAAEKDMKYVMSLLPSLEGGSTIIRGIYENFRALGDSLLVVKGIETADHKGMIQELMSLKVKADRPLGALDSLRRLRHDINYRGYIPSLDEVEEARSLSKSLFVPILKEVRIKLSGMNHSIGKS